MAYTPNQTGETKVNNTSINNEPVAVSVPGVPVFSLAGPTGDRIDSIGGGLSVKVNDTAPVNVQQKAAAPTAVFTLQSGATANGDGLSMNVAGYATAILSVTAPTAMSGGTTVNFEASIDAATWVSIVATPMSGSKLIATSTTTTGDWELNIAGYSYVRARISAYSAGTVIVRGTVSVLDATQNTVVATLSTPAQTALGMYGQVTPYGTSKVTVEPSTLLIDLFDGTIDPVRWTTGGTNLPTSANGQLTQPLSTTVNASSTLQSNATFSPSLGFLTGGESTSLESVAPGTTNNHRFWGLGVVNAFTFATPLTDGVGFEVDSTGALNCVVYIGGTRYVVNSTNTSLITAQGSLPTGAATSTYGQSISWQGTSRIYAFSFRGDTAFFYIGNLEVPVGVASGLQPQTQALPYRRSSINGSSAVTATTFTGVGIGVGDTTAQNNFISDPIYPWRRMTIDANGAASQNITEVKGSAISTGYGTSDTGTIRVSKAFDSPEPVLDQILLELQKLSGADINNAGLNIRRQLDQYGRELITAPANTLTYSTAFTGSTSETTIIPAYAGQTTILVGLVIANSSASTNSLITIRDFTGTADPQGTHYFESIGGAPTTGFSGGGLIRIPQRTPGQAWTAQCGTSTTSIYVTAYYQLV